VKLLIQSKADLDLQDKAGETCLMAGAYSGHVTCLEMLVESGANLDLKNRDGETALMCVTGSNNTEGLKMLLASKADLTIQSRHGHALMYAAAMNSVDSTAVLLKCSPTIVNLRHKKSLKTALMTAAGNGCKIILQMLIDAKADLNAQDTNGNTAIMWAAMSGEKEIVDKLYLLGAETSDALRNKAGETPLSLISRTIPNSAALGQYGAPKLARFHSDSAFDGKSGTPALSRSPSVKKNSGFLAVPSPRLFGRTSTSRGSSKLMSRLSRGNSKLLSRMSGSKNFRSAPNLYLARSPSASSKFGASPRYGSPSLSGRANSSSILKTRASLETPAVEL